MLLYKYYPCNEFTFRALSLRGLWCHNPTSANDPFECLGAMSPAYSPEELEAFRGHIRSLPRDRIDKRLATIADLSDERLNKLLADLRQEFVSKFSFCALSETFDDVLMWSYYANGHTGCVIGFEFENDLNGHLHKVTYANEPTKLDLQHFAELLLDSTNNIGNIFAQLSVKGPMWAHEREWRIWGTKSGYQRYESTVIKKVVFGVRCPMETKSILLKLLADLPEGFQFDLLELRYSPLRLES